MATYQNEDTEVAKIASGGQSQDYDDNNTGRGKVYDRKRETNGELYYFGVSSEEKPVLLKDIRGARVSYIAPGDSHIIVVTDEGGGRARFVPDVPETEGKDEILTILGELERGNDVGFVVLQSDQTVQSYQHRLGKCFPGDVVTRANWVYHTH